MNENAKKDLKEGLLLYNSENNVGLKNAWNIIQAEVRAGGGGRCGWKAGPGPQTPPPSLGWATGFLGQTWCSGRQLQRGSGAAGQVVGCVGAWMWPAAIQGSGSWESRWSSGGHLLRPILSEASARMTVF